MEILIELEKTCTKPELKLNSKDVATNEIDAKIKKFEIILEVFFIIISFYYKKNRKFKN